MSTPNNLYNKSNNENISDTSNETIRRASDTVALLKGQYISRR